MSDAEKARTDLDAVADGLDQVADAPLDDQLTALAEVERALRGALEENR